jgi:hypothetical protein
MPHTVSEYTITDHYSYAPNGSNTLPLRADTDGALALLIRFVCGEMPPTGDMSHALRVVASVVERCADPEECSESAAFLGLTVTRARVQR